MNSAQLAVGFALAGSWACAQQYTISTFAGSGLPQKMPGAEADLGPVTGATADAAGNVFFSVPDYHIVLRLDASTGQLTLVAGNGTFGNSGDNGAAIYAQLWQPGGLTLDATGNLYIADELAAVVRKVATNGIITTVAGDGTSNLYGSGDGGPATSAELRAPSGLAVDAEGSLYIADAQSVRKVSNGVITTVAGMTGVGTSSGFGGDNGPATSALLSFPSGVAFDASGNLYIADSGNNRVRKVSNGVITTVVGNGTQGFSGDAGPAAIAQLNGPESVAVDATGSLYIADNGNNRVRKVSVGVINTVAGNGTQGFSGDMGPATGALLSNPVSVALDSAGNLYIADDDNSRVRRVSQGVITTVAGGGLEVGDNGAAKAAELRNPFGVALGPDGSLYVSDSAYRVRKVANGIITTVAGNGTPGLSGDGGLATSAQLGSFLSINIAVDATGNLYIADTGNNKIRKVSNGIITTVAGNGTSGLGGDGGPATSAQLTPASVAVDSTGNLYIADASNNLVRKVSNGIITTVAGNGTTGFSGDGGPATHAQLNRPESVSVDSSGNLYVADALNARIREVSNGIITTVAGNGQSARDSGDNGPATSAALAGSYNLSVAVDAEGSIYIAEGGCGSGGGVFSGCRIRKVTAGTITTIAGNGMTGFSGDNGPATDAVFANPEDIVVGTDGKVYVSDYQNNRVRVLTPFGSSLLALTGVSNAASYLANQIAPGEIVVLQGVGLGPSQLTECHVNSLGNLDAQCAGTTASFNGILAPIIYAWATQVAAIVPYEVSGASNQVSVTYQGQTSPAATVNVVQSAPGLFTLDATGKGQAAAVNQDGSLNTPGHPASIGSYVSLFATGEGQTSPAGVDGKPAQVPLPHPLLPVTVTIGGVAANVQYAGGAPGEVAGVMQINVQIPVGLQTGNVPVVVKVGDTQSQSDVTIAVAEN